MPRTAGHEVGKERALSLFDPRLPLAAGDRAADRPLPAEGVRRVGILPALVARRAGLRAARREEVGILIVDDEVGEVFGIEHGKLEVRS